MYVQTGGGAAAVVVNWMPVWAAAAMAAVVVAAAAASCVFANRREFVGFQQDSFSTVALAPDSKQTSSSLHRCHSLQRLMCLTVHACMDMHGHPLPHFTPSCVRVFHCPACLVAAAVAAASRPLGMLVGIAGNVMKQNAISPPPTNAEMATEEESGRAGRNFIRWVGGRLEA